MDRSEHRGQAAERTGTVWGRLVHRPACDYRRRCRGNGGQAGLSLGESEQRGVPLNRVNAAGKGVIGVSVIGEGFYSPVPRTRA